MAAENIPNIMRDFVKSMEKGDVDKALSFLTDDVDWVTPTGTIKGKDQIRRYFSSEAMKGLTVTESGNGIIAQGNRALFEHDLEATYRGRKAKWLAICAYEFNGDKIQHMRTVFDRLSLAQQMSSGLPKMLVNQIVKQSEKMVR